MVVQLSGSDSEFFVEQLIDWFRLTKRDLPWRKSYDPYHVWISEIILQQTQMDRGVRYFNRWIVRFPSVQDVANATEDEILTYWEGLGYYARARNLHKAAKVVVQEHSSIVPADYVALLKLPGIGPYTAAAVASIAGNQNVAVVDANVNRIFARVLDIAEPVKSSGPQKMIHELVNLLLPKGKARVFNQALMDFGGLVCTPKAPRCEECTIQNVCRAYANVMVAARPVLKAPPKTIHIHRLAAIIISKGYIYMQKRNHSAVWGGLWEFPGGETVVGSNQDSEIDLTQEINKDTGLYIIDAKFLIQTKHQYTHHKVSLDTYICILKDGELVVPRLAGATGYRWVTPQEMDQLPCPSGVRKVIEYIKTIKPQMFSDNIAYY